MDVLYLLINDVTHNPPLPTIIEMLQNVFLYLVLKNLDQIVFQNTFGLNDFNLVIFGFEPESSHQGAL